MRGCQDRSLVEAFHLYFLRHLGNVLDKSLYAVKGGCNLRFFLKSIRYSEDLDIDTRIIAKETLQSKVRQVVAATAFINALRSQGMQIASFSEPKQTDTTQRWKFTLAIHGRALPLHTKIEFSRRGIEEETTVDAITVEISRFHTLPPFLLPHYTAAAAFLQKVNALVNRSETQARDIFDLIHLLRIGVLPATFKNAFSSSILSKAQSLVMAMDFDDFKSQVIAYLDPEFQRAYDSKDGMEALSLGLVEALEEMRP